MKRLALLWAVVVLVLAPAPRAEEPTSGLPVGVQDIEKLLRTDFYGVYLPGKKIG